MSRSREAGGGGWISLALEVWLLGVSAYQVVIVNGPEGANDPVYRLGA